MTFNFDKIVLGMICVAIVLGITVAVISIFIPKPQSQIIFKVVGINNNSINNTSLVQIHFECIKWCEQSSYINNCWKECQTLGREGCKND